MLEPVRDNIVLKVIEENNETAGGIILSAGAVEKPCRGVVLAVNESFAMPDGSMKKAECAVGDTVVYGRSHGTEVKHGGEVYLVIAEEFILAKEK